MKLLLIISTAFFFSMASLVLAHPWTPDDDEIIGIPVDGAVQIHSRALGIGHLDITVSNPIVKMDAVELNKRSWTLVTIDGETRLWQTGKPALPLISRAIRLPNTGNVNVKVTPGDFVDYPNIDVLPQQPTELKKIGDHLEPISYAFDESAYKTDAWFPAEIARLSTPEIIRDARIALLGVQPVQYNPVTRTLRVYNSIEIETIPTGGVGTNELYSTVSHAVPSFAGIYSDIIGAEDLFDDARRAPPGQIMFICRTGVDTLLRPFVAWKTASGRPAQIVTTTTTTAAALQTTINNAYNSWNPPLESVVLVADGGSTTNTYELPTYNSFSIPSDHDYSRVGQSSLLASIWVGRILCDNTQQLVTQLNRSMNYERTPYMGSTGADTFWLSYGWGYAGTAMNVVSNRPAIRFCLEMMRVRGLSNLPYDEFNGNEDPSLISTRLSGGALFWAERGAWTGEINSFDMSNIFNTYKPFISLNITCATGDWYGPSATGVPKFLTQLGTPTQPKGAITAMSTQTSGANCHHSNSIATGTYYALGVQNARQPGPMYFEGKFQMWRNYRFGDSTQSVMFLYMNNPMGDISVNFWTGVPHQLNTNAPGILAIGENRLALQVLQATNPVPGAMVTVWKKNSGGTNETYTRAITDDSGRVLLTLNNSSAGNMFLTITGNQPNQNFTPIIDTIQVIQSAVDLSYTTQTILDDNNSGRSGNSDGNANPGEIVDLSVQLINRGTNVATPIHGTLVSNDSRIVVLADTTNWNADSAGLTVGSITPFRIHLLSALSDNEQIPLQLNLSTDEGNRTITVPLTVRSIHVTFISAVTNPTTINPGQSGTLSITVRNIGGFSSNLVHVTLLSYSHYAVISLDSSVFPTLPIGTNVSNPANRLFDITINGRLVEGSIVPFRAVFSSGLVQDTIAFTITAGTRHNYDPTGPDEYGYFAFDNTDTAYLQLTPVYNWVEINPAYNGNGTNLQLNDNVRQASSGSNDTSAVRRLPFSVPYYGAVYDSVTIASNGWLAFGVQPHYNNLRNWHLPPQEGPRNIVAVNWCEQTDVNTNEGVFAKYDSTNHRYIVTWKTTTLYTPSPQEYQVILYDPVYYHTPTGDANLLFQYKTFNPAPFSGSESGVSYATVGIADSTYTRGLEYCYWNDYTAGSAPIPTGTPTFWNRAILFTTSTRITGTLEGTVRRISNNQGIPGITVTTLNTFRSAVTDSAGHYIIPDMQIGRYSVRASGIGVNTFIDTVSIYDSVISTLNFLLTSPGIRITVNDTIVHPNDSVWVSLSDTGQTANQRILLRNTGNGVLTWNTQLLYDAGTDELDSLWQPVFSFDATEACGGDSHLSGVEFDGRNFWISGTNNYAVPHYLYKLDRTGHLLHTYDCPDSNGLFGWRDLAWDGHYLYGSYSHYIDKIDTTNGQVVRRYLTTLDPVRALAVDTATGTIYYCDQSSAIYKMRLSDGVVLGSLPNPLSPNPGGVYGLAWMPAAMDSMKLYAFVRDSSARTHGMRIYKINPYTGTAIALTTLGLPYEDAGGLAITSSWNPLIWSVVTMLESNAGCRVSLFELAFNRQWISYNPTSDSLQPGHLDTVNVHFDSRFMPVGRYRVSLGFTSNVTDTMQTVPVIMVVTPFLSITERHVALPDKLTLEQNYPNPFNNATTLRFSLPEKSKTRICIYNIAGQEVAVLLNNTINAGSYRFNWNAQLLSSGVYFVRLESNNVILTKKMILLK